MHPLPYIEELAALKNITNFHDVVRLNNFVFTTVPWTKDPFVGREQYFYDVQTLYYYFKYKRIGGWCGLNATFFSKLLMKYKIEHFWFDYGLTEHQYTHVVVAVKIGEDYHLFDPYFGKYYVDNAGNPLPYSKLLEFVQQEQFDQFRYAYSPDITKPTQLALYYQSIGNEFTQAEGETWTEMKPETLYRTIYRVWKRLGYDQTMKEHFGRVEHEMLLSKPLQKQSPEFIWRELP